MACMSSRLQHLVKPSLVRAVHAAITARALRSKMHHQSAPGAEGAGLEPTQDRLQQLTVARAVVAGGLITGPGTDVGLPRVHVGCACRGRNDRIPSIEERCCCLGLVE